jgi:hypothetical protein
MGAGLTGVSGGRGYCHLARTWAAHLFRTRLRRKISRSLIGLSSAQRAEIRAVFRKDHAGDEREIVADLRRELRDETEVAPATAQRPG